MGSKTILKILNDFKVSISNDSTNNEYGIREEDFKELANELATPKVYVISLRGDKINTHSRKLFLDKDLALKYWDKVGKEEYTYLEESISY